jgi:Ca2+-binding EF-hand superfamily protein
MFTRLDTDGDRRLGFEEFKQAVPVLNQWGIKVTNPQESFKEIDSDGGGKVLFDEFCVWAANKNLDIDDDDDFSMSSEDAQKLTNSDIKIKSEQKTEGFKNQNNDDTSDFNIVNNNKSSLDDSFTSNSPSVSSFTGSITGKISSLLSAIKNRSSSKSKDKI